MSKRFTYFSFLSILLPAAVFSETSTSAYLEYYPDLSAYSLPSESESYTIISISLAVLLHSFSLHGWYWNKTRLLTDGLAVIVIMIYISAIVYYHIDSCSDYTHRAKDKPPNICKVFIFGTVIYPLLTLVQLIDCRMVFYRYELLHKGSINRYHRWSAYFIALFSITPSLLEHTIFPAFKISGNSDKRWKIVYVLSDLIFGSFRYVYELLIILWFLKRVQRGRIYLWATLSLLLILGNFACLITGIVGLLTAILMDLYIGVELFSGGYFSSRENYVSQSTHRIFFLAAIKSVFYNLITITAWTLDFVLGNVSYFATISVIILVCMHVMFNSRIIDSLLGSIFASLRVDLASIHLTSEDMMEDLSVSVIAYSTSRQPASTQTNQTIGTIISYISWRTSSVHIDDHNSLNSENKLSTTENITVDQEIEVTSLACSDEDSIVEQVDHNARFPLPYADTEIKIERSKDSLSRA